MPIRTSRRTGVVTVTSLGLATLFLGTAATAAAAPAAPAASAAKPVLLVTYDVAGSTTLANPNSRAVVTFAPTAINVGLQADGTFRANLPLAPVTSTFDAHGFLPSSGTVVFTQVKPVTGALGAVAGGPLITSTATYVVSLRDVTIGGTKANVGANCQTVNPVRVTVASEPDFGIATGGSLSGTYTLGRFQNCGAAQTVINNTLPGAGNRLSLVFSNGTLTSPDQRDPRAVAASLLPH